MAEFLQLAADEQSMMLVEFGRPDRQVMVANSTKKPVASLSRNSFEMQ